MGPKIDMVMYSDISPHNTDHKTYFNYLNVFHLIILVFQGSLTSTSMSGVDSTHFVVHCFISVVKFFETDTTMQRIYTYNSCFCLFRGIFSISGAEIS